VTDVPPGHAFIAWAKSIPAAHCTAAAFAPWTHAAERSAVPVTATARFDSTTISLPLGKMTTVASSGSRYWYSAASDAHRRIAVLHAGSEEEESDFAAVLSGAPAAPRTLARLPDLPHFAAGLGIGSTRAAVESVLGHAKSTPACGFDLVRYEPKAPVMSESTLWIVYRRGVVAAFSRYVAV
jgi:hypothetical protein